MSDLVDETPALNINLHTVTPEERKDKVLRELSRATFQKIGVS